MAAITRVMCWFSCGAASAVATKLTLMKYKHTNIPVEIHYQDTGSEHPDNKRFLLDCEQWFGQKIIISKSPKYVDHWDVMEKSRYIHGPAGAPCTGKLKRMVAEELINFGYDLEIFGYTADEAHRATKFIAHNNERKIETPLIDQGLTKDDCLALLVENNIEIPAMYLLGYNNNNCIGCPKGGIGYWNKIRETHPEAFERMAKLERKLGATVLADRRGGKKVRQYLDTLEPDRGHYPSEPSISCGIICQSIELEEAP